MEHGKNVAVTSQKRRWGLHVGAKFVDDINFVQVKADTSFQDLDSDRPYRSKYDPRALAYRDPRPLSDFDLDRLSTITKGDSGLLLYHLPPDKPPNINDVATNVEVTTCCEPLTVKEAVQASCTKSPDQIIEKLSLTYDQQTSLASSTTKQDKSQKWHIHRRGRVTASVAAECVTKLTDNNPPQLKPGHSCLAKVMGYYGQQTSPALQWGKNMEDIAKRQYVAHHKLHHKHTCICKDTGLWVSLRHPYIAGSPDALIYCVKCEGGIPGVLEIKNPYTHRYLTITELVQQKESSGLVIQNDKIQLNRAHKYFTQIQVQLHATDYSWCDFVVRTVSKKDNFHVERIYRDERFLQSIIPKLEFFFSYAVVPEVLSTKVQDIVVKNAVQGVLNAMLIKLEKATETIGSISYPCGTCGLICEDDPADSKDESIGCDTCQLWYHYLCVGLTGSESVVTNRKSKWKCETCKNLSARKRRKTEP